MLTMSWYNLIEVYVVLGVVFGFGSIVAFFLPYFTTQRPCWSQGMCLRVNYLLRHCVIDVTKSVAGGVLTGIRGRSSSWHWVSTL
jgi:hypothetical protein